MADYANESMHAHALDEVWGMANEVKWIWQYIERL